MAQLVRTVAMLMESLAASSQMPLAPTLEGSEAPGHLHPSVRLDIKTHTHIIKNSKSQSLNKGPAS